MSTIAARQAPSTPLDFSEDVRAGYKQTEVGIIPQDWKVRRLRDLFDFSGGYSASRKQLTDVGHCYLHYGDIHGSTKTSIDTRTDYLRIPKLDISLRDVPPKSLLKDGDVVFVDASEDDEGASKHVVVVNKDELPFISGLHTIVAKGKADELVHEYRHYCFQTRSIRLQFLYYAVGTKVTGISKSNIPKLLLPLPRPDEQHAIAEALSDVDGLLETLEALIAKKRAIKQAAMQQLLTGRSRLPGFSGEWQQKPIDALAAVDPENLSSATEPDYSFNYISLEQVDSGRLLGVSEETFRTAPSRARRVLRHDDVLMSTVRPNLMAHLHFRSQVDNAVCSTGFAVLRARPGVADPSFLVAHLFGHVVNQQVESTLAGSNYPAINSGDVRMLQMPCPPTVEEQTAIATVLSDMDAEIAALEARRDKTRAIKQGMMQQLLTGRVRLMKPAMEHNFMDEAGC